MAKNYPSFERGRKLYGITAEQWRTLVDAARNVDGLSVRPPLRLRRDKQGIVLSVDFPRKMPSKEAVEQLFGVDTVLLVAAPIAADTSLSVRSVQYKDTPPVQGSYSWYDDPYTAYPDFGHKAIDYADFVHPAGTEPGLDSHFLGARWQNGSWLIGYPLMPSSTSLAVVIDSFPSETHTSRFLTVLEVDLQPDGTYAAKPGVRPRSDVLCWPYMKAGDYLVLRSMTPQNVVELKMINGKVYAAHDFRKRIIKPNSSYSASDCPI